MHGRTDIGKKCTCRGKSRDALTDITGERSWCKKRGETSLEKDPTPLGIKSFGIRIYAAAVQSFVADFTSDGEEETSSRDEIKRRNIYVTFSLSRIRSIARIVIEMRGTKILAIFELEYFYSFLRDLFSD